MTQSFQKEYDKSKDSLCQPFSQDIFCRNIEQCILFFHLENQNIFTLHEQIYIVAFPVV